MASFRIQLRRREAVAERTMASQPGYGPARSSACFRPFPSGRPSRPTGRWVVHAPPQRHQTLWLFYSNNRPEDAAFLDDLKVVAGTTPSFHFVPTMTNMAESKQAWQGETGFIDREMLPRHLPQLAGAVYYVAGPPAMVTAMRDMLVGAGVDEDDVRSEEFAGY